MKRSKLFFFLIFVFFVNLIKIDAAVFKVVSPNRMIKLNLIVDNDIRISVKFGKYTVLKPSAISMKLISGELGKNSKVIGTKRYNISEILHPVVKVKEAKVENRCNELVVSFKNNFYIRLRAYNDGIAYRFGTNFRKEITVVSEKGEYEFSGNHMVWWGKEKKFQSHNQVYFDYRSIQKSVKKDLTSLPLIINPLTGPKIVIVETDLIDYPGMWLRGTGENILSRVSAKYPKKTVQRSDRNLEIIERENYIARTSGRRTFPWRIFIITEKDADLIKNQLTYILASPSKIRDTSWIKPGKVAWDWWNANNIKGVDFRAGINTKTYKYYIDFASTFGIENILLDEGWYKLGDLSSIVPDIDMKEILSYAKEKGVGVILWCVWKTLDDQLEKSLEQFEKWGITGIKVDFMNRDDQKMVDFYHKIAKKAAEHHLLVDFHGSYKPSGIRRIYPNVLTREGVNGGEQFKWSINQTPEHDLIIPFGRMVAGPMDYTPGAMHNALEKDFKPIFDTPMSMGTRCHQLAMYVCYESPLQMLCDSPSNYYREPLCMEFLSDVPTVWDETVVLTAKISDYLVIARRNGDNWFIGGMTDWSPRDIKLNFSFLKKGVEYKLKLYRDGINADRIATDFKRTMSKVDSKSLKRIHLVGGGGFAAVLTPVKQI